MNSSTYYGSIENTETSIIDTFNELLEYKPYETSNEIIDDDDYINNPLLPKESNDVVIQTDDNMNDCSICIEQLGLKPYINLKCEHGTHKFHEDCFVITLNALKSTAPNSSNFKCPMCRSIHSYEKVGGPTGNYTISFEEFWFKKSIYIVTRIETTIFLIGMMLYAYYVFKLCKNKYKEQFPSYEYPVSHDFYVALIFHCILTYNIVLFRYMNISKHRSINFGLTSDIEWYNFPFIPSIITIMFYTAYFLLNYLVYTNKVLSLLIVYSYPLILFLGLFISYLIVNNCFFKNPERCDKYLVKCQKITNILYKTYREQMKKEFCSKFKIWNNKQEFTIEIKPE